MNKPKMSALPVVLTHKPRHRTESSDWELEFALKKTPYEIHPEELAILGTALRQMNRNREELERKSWIRLRLEGLEQFLRELNRLAIICLAKDKTGAVSRLGVRALHDFIIAVDGTLSGQHVVMFESMRDVMEIELLVREFKNQPQRIHEWVNSDKPSLKKKFAPNVLRQLHANRLGVKPQDLPENADYQAHSVGLHVTPFREIPPFGGRDMIVDSSDPFAVDACFWELFRHARSLLKQIWEFLEGHPPNIEKNTRLREFVVADESVTKSAKLYYGILEAISRQLSTLPPDDGTISIELDVVPEEYKQVFRELSDGGSLSARVFPRL
jgi:hypothetical protein